LDDVGSMNTYRKYTRAHRIFANAKIVNQENVAPLRPLEQPVVHRSKNVAPLCPLEQPVVRRSKNVAPLCPLEQPVVRRSQRQVSRRLFDSVS